MSSRISRVVTSSARFFSSTSPSISAIRHLRATKNTSGRFFALGNTPAGIEGIDEQTRYDRDHTYQKLNTSVHSLSRGIVDSINTIAPELRESYRAGYEVVLENNPYVPHIINPKRPSLPPATVEYNLVTEGPEVIIDIYETFVAPELRGAGVAKELMTEAVEYAKGYGYKVRPTCSYAAKYLEANAPELIATPKQTA